MTTMVLTQGLLMTAYVVKDGAQITESRFLACSRLLVIILCSCLILMVGGYHWSIVIVLLPIHVTLIQPIYSLPSQ